MPREQGLEVEAGEPLVRLDVLRPALDATIALREVRDEQLLDEALGVLVHKPREGELPREDQLVDLLMSIQTYSRQDSAKKNNGGGGAAVRHMALTLRCLFLFSFHQHSTAIQGTTTRRSSASLPSNVGSDRTLKFVSTVSDGVHGRKRV